MQTSLSFRIWDKALNKWVEADVSGTHCFTETYISLTGEVVKFSAGFPEQDKEPLFSKDDSPQYINNKWYGGKIGMENRYVVQRGTGMKDINGKEIFEGDIIKVDESIAQVSYFDGAFWAEEANENTLLLVHSWEVIGNIFENADLIK